MNISLDRNSAFHSLGIGINHQGGNSSSIGTHPPFGSEAFKNSEQGRKRLQAIPAQSEPEQKRMRIEVEKEKKKDGHSSSATEVRAGEDVVIVESVNAPLEDEQSTTSEDDVVSSSENGNEKATTIMPRTTKNQAMQFWIDGIKRGGRLPALRCISNLNEFRDEDGQPLLHLVIIYKSKNTTKAKELIERMVVKMRADINIQNSENETALHLAVKNGKLALIRHLIKLGASNKIKDKEGKCPLDLAPDSKTRKAFD